MARIALICLLFLPLTVLSQSSRDLAVEVWITVSPPSPDIKIQWPFSDAATQYQVFRKDKTAAGWGIAKANLPGTALFYKDSLVVSGKEYEYKIVRTEPGLTAYGYALAGLNIPLKETKGRLLLVCEEGISLALSSEIRRFVEDMEGDGWAVQQIAVAASLPVKDVKGQITDWYALDKNTAKAVVLLGHVPVPYSGNLNPDGHPDHQGAWPCDAFYGDMDGNWPDLSVSNALANDVRNRNVPGDGKYDPSIFPSNIELQVGRIDFENLPLFAKNATELTRQYLQKNHEYRHKIWQPDRKAVIDDNFGFFSGEAFASTGWRNFSALCGPQNVVEGDYFSTMSQQSNLWSYGCGPGSYGSAGGVGTSVDFSKNNLNGVFTILFGSYFGDWDSQNNLMRSALAQGRILTCAWGGRPHWYFHHMGLGENIGFSALQTQNNNGLYYTHYAGKFVHISLLGDPTLRNDVVSPPANLVAQLTNTEIKLQWTAATDSVLGYLVYMKKPGASSFVKVNPNIQKDLYYTLPCAVDSGQYIFMVKAVKVENQFSGSYYNTSQGLIDTLFQPMSGKAIAKGSYSIKNNTVSFTSQSFNASSVKWIFDNGQTSSDNNPVIYLAAGVHTAILIASNACSADTLSMTIEITSHTYEVEKLPTDMILYPNPAQGEINWICYASAIWLGSNLEIQNYLGHTVYASTLQKESESLDISHFPNGIYLFSLISPKGSRWSQPFVISH